MRGQPVCPGCGTQPRPTARFCGGCGRLLQQPSPIVVPPPGPSVPARPWWRWRRRSLLLALLLALVTAGWVWSHAQQARSGPARPASAPVARAATPTPTSTSRPVQPTAPPTLIATPAQPLPIRSGQLQVHFIDVGQGDSILIQTPGGTTALIDGGYNNGQALAYLQTQGIARIDVLIASHPHADHIGGLVEVLDALPVGVVWTSGAAHTTGIFEQFLDAIDQANVPYREARTGDTIALGELQLVVLRSAPDAAELNDSSLVLHLQHGTVSFLFTGDAEQLSEAALLRTSRPQLAATVLKVGHHGSYTSSSPDFLAAVAPEVAIYSAGIDNSYGHPHAQTIQALTAAHARVYGTPIHGTVLVQSDGQRYEVHPTRSDDPAAPVTVIGSASERDEPDRNCADFATHAEAQAFFIAAGGPVHDPHRLDGDDDGKACESLP